MREDSVLNKVGGGRKQVAVSLVSERVGKRNRKREKGGGGKGRQEVAGKTHEASEAMSVILFINDSCFLYWNTAKGLSKTADCVLIILCICVCVCVISNHLQDYV